MGYHINNKRVSALFFNAKISPYKSESTKFLLIGYMKPLHNNFDIKIKDKYLQLNPNLLSYMYKEFDEKIKTWIDTKTGYRLMMRI